MKQILSKSERGIGFAINSKWGNVLGGQHNVADTDTYGSAYMRIPVPIAGTFRNLTLLSHESSALEALLYKNAAATSLNAVLDGTSQGSDTVNHVTVIPGDDVALRWSGLFPFGNPGVHCGFALEFDGLANIYGMSPTVGTIGPPDCWYGGAFGNGFLQQHSGLPIDGSDQSVSYSICAVPGTITTICLKEIAPAGTGGGWTAYARVNRVIDIGSATSLADGDGFVIGSIDVRCELLDHVELVVQRTGTSSGFSTGHIGVSIAYRPDVTGAFMLCGGSNDALSNSADQYLWVDPGQLLTSESAAAAPVGQTGFSVTGLHIEVSDPDGAATVTTTFRVSGADTLATVSVSSGATSGDVSGIRVRANAGGYVSMLHSPSGTPSVGELHWGVAASVGSGEIGPLLWWRFARTQP